MLEGNDNPFKPPMGYTRLYTVTELAELFHLSRPTMANYLKRGDVRAKKVGSKWAILLEDMPYSSENKLIVAKR